MQTITFAEFFRLHQQELLIDVRSPLEYAKGHIPNSFSVPLFSNDGRAQVGTVYKQEGKEAAIRLGLTLINIPSMVAEIDRLIGSKKKIFITCFRGGMRSQSVGWLCELLGCQVFLLEKGYKGFRRFVLEQFARPYNLQLLGGRTGVGKTALLKELKERGENTIDLEAFANHRGSVFGGIERKQPTQEQFENELALALFEYENDAKIWVEAESRNIGVIRIPEAFFNSMREAKVWVVEEKREERIKRSLLEYGGYDKELLKKAVKMLEKRLGSEKTVIVLQFLDNGDFSKACDILLDYYDQKYDYDLAKRDQKQLIFCTKESLGGV